MEQYINKAALVAKIDKRKNLCEKIVLDLRTKENKDYYQGKAVAYSEMVELINTPEVKGVDLEKEVDEWLKYGPHTDYPWCSVPDAIEITAEHFFELGLKAQKGE